MSPDRARGADRSESVVRVEAGDTDPQRSPEAVRLTSALLYSSRPALSCSRRCDVAFAAPRRPRRPCCWPARPRPAPTSSRISSGGSGASRWRPRARRPRGSRRSKPRCIRSPAGPAIRHNSPTGARACTPRRAGPPSSAHGCLACHAPLAEQGPFVAAGRELRANPTYDAALAGKGVPCAGCHVRGHERFGPPRRDGFSLNGKLLQATYDEWKASRFARAGIQCQDCHMPDRRHRWRGIHDAEIVRSGLTITAKTGAARYRPGEVAVVTLRVESTRVGHAFPTYVTPRVVLSAELVDAAGQAVAGSRQEQVIGREVALDLSRELSDTRLLPGRSATFTSRMKVEAPGMRVRVAVVVEPDAFYVAFFETLLRQGAGRGEAQIREALEAARRSPFTVFERDLPLS